MRTVWRIVAGTIREFGSDRCAQMAAAIAFHVLFSLMPAMALLLGVFGMVMRNPNVEETVLDHLLQNVPLNSGLVIDTLRTISRAGEPLSLFSAVALLWASMGLVAAVREALNAVWGVKPRRNLIRQRLADLGAVVGIGVLLATSVVGTIALHDLSNLTVVAFGVDAAPLEVGWEVVGWAFPAAITFLLFLLLYRYVPNVSHGLADVWPGALVATLLFETAKHAFTFYVSNFDRYEALYGTLGAVMLFLLWVYVSAIVLLIGAELASVYEQSVRRKAQAAPASLPPRAGAARAGSVNAAGAPERPALRRAR